MSILSSLLPRKKKKKNRLFNLQGDRVEEHYAIGEELGKGAFAKVKLGRHLKSGERVAVKVIDKNSLEVKTDALRTEVKILMNIKHSNVVNLIDVFEDDDRLYLIMELMAGGELFNKICNDYPSGYSEKQAAALTRQIIEAVHYLHGKGIIHRDLKPENLLFATPESRQIKISDFGLAKIWSADTLIRTACGSPNYVAPEVLNNKSNGYTSVVDMWSVGVIVYVLLCGFCPFFDENTPALFRAIMKADYSFPSPYWDGISEDARDFIRKLLVLDPTKRLTSEQALRHRWVEKNEFDTPIANITEKMHKFNVSRSQAALGFSDGE